MDITDLDKLKEGGPRVDLSERVAGLEATMNFHEKRMDRYDAMAKETAQAMQSIDVKVDAISQQLAVAAGVRAAMQDTNAESEKRTGRHLVQLGLVLTGAIGLVTLIAQALMHYVFK